MCCPRCNLCGNSGGIDVESTIIVIKGVYGRGTCKSVAEQIHIIASKMEKDVLITYGMVGEDS